MFFPATASVFGSNRQQPRHQCNKQQEEEQQHNKQDDTPSGSHPQSTFLLSCPAPSLRLEQRRINTIPPTSVAKRVVTSRSAQEADPEQEVGELAPPRMLQFADDDELDLLIPELPLLHIEPSKIKDGRGASFRLAMKSDPDDATSAGSCRRRDSLRRNPRVERRQSFAAKCA